MYARHIRLTCIRFAFTITYIYALCIYAAFAFDVVHTSILFLYNGPLKKDYFILWRSDIGIGIGTH